MRQKIKWSYVFRIDTSSCWHGNEPLGSINCGQFLCDLYWHQRIKRKWYPSTVRYTYILNLQNRSHVLSKTDITNCFKHYQFWRTTQCGSIPHANTLSFGSFKPLLLQTRLSNLMWMYGFRQLSCNHHCFIILVHLKARERFSSSCDIPIVVPCFTQSRYNEQLQGIQKAVSLFANTAVHICCSTWHINTDALNVDDM